MRDSHRASWLAALLAAAVTACSGGGGGDAYVPTATLLALEFLDPNDVNREAAPDDAPQSAPLTQQIRFTFSAAPDPARVHSTAISIVDEANIPVDGSWHIDGAVLTFTPRLPTRAVTTTVNGAIDDGGAGLEFGAGYTVRVGQRTFSFVGAVDPVLRARHPDPADPRGILIRFRTMATPGPDAFRGLPVRAPRLIDVSPRDGSVAVSPNLHGDPDGLFAPPAPFTLTFDAPLDPSATQLNDTVFQLIDLDDHTAQFPFGLPLGIDVSLRSNETDGAVVEVAPSGILPFARLLALQYDRELKGIAELGAPAGGPVVASTFTVAVDPGGTIRDELVETFDDNAGEERDLAEVGNGVVAADWNRAGSTLLQAALEFNGTGRIGRFIPYASNDSETVTIVLDTASQPFPLIDGSTPDAPPGYVAQGGIFDFTDVDIPDGVEIVVVGSNPLVFRCSGTVRIAGTIRLAGEDGASEYAYDSAITPIPGGNGVAGGGDGGESHPLVFFPPDQINYLTLVSPSAAGTGWGLAAANGLMQRVGGTGAECGALDLADTGGRYQTDNEFGDCKEARPGNGDCRLAGGGGGSLLQPGAPPQTSKGVRLDGIGNVVPDGTGRFLLDPADRTLRAGDAGQHPFAPDGSASNDFYGKLGQLSRLVGGQGGGGGGSLTDSYFCGTWCDLDGDPANDGVCDNGDDMPKKGRSPAVGDSRGGGGGAGGGCFLVQALGSITLAKTGVIDAIGGSGGGGEGVSCSYFGGGGGGGSGGMVVFQSAESVLVESKAVIDVRRGHGEDASMNNGYAPCDSDGSNVGDGGEGGHGLVQLQVPAGQVATVVSPGTTETNGSIRPPAAWIDRENVLAPVEFTALSVAMSEWHDFGRVVDRLPAGTNPLVEFSGTDAAGYVRTAADGQVLDPRSADIVCGYLGQIDPVTHAYLEGEEPRPDFIPPSATVRVEFQGGDALVRGSKEVDPASLTAWSADVGVASGRQFLRWRITFDTTADGADLSIWTRRPVVERMQVRAEF